MRMCDKVLLFLNLAIDISRKQKNGGSSFMTYSDFLDSILSQKLTLNEICLLIELGFSNFRREDLLVGEKRAPKNTYSPSALTRTTQKLLKKSNPMVTQEEDSGKTVYRLIDRYRFPTYGRFEHILLEVARSKLTTLMSIRTAIMIIQNDNIPCSARFLANKLDVDADYMASSVLPRMYVVGLLQKHVLSDDFEHHLTEEDRKIPDILGFNLNLHWEGKVHGRWL